MKKPLFSDQWAYTAYFSLENCSEMIFWVRQDGSFEYVNPAVIKALGYSKRELMDMNASDLIVDYDQEHREDLRAKIDRKGQYLTRTSLRRKNGTAFPVESVNNSIEFNGETLNCAFARDISNRVRKEEVLMKAQARLKSENDALKSTFDLSDHLRIIGTSRLLVAVLEKAEMVALNNRPVLITGESGVGKESMAKYVHLKSRRRDRVMVSINCAALPEETIISTLFGHVKGAFTGAFQDRIGLFQQANNSTLFLDEIGELSLNVQAMLLRVIEYGKYSRMGDGVTLETDVRIIAVTNRKLKRMVREKKFRGDLFYRLNVLRLKLPPLRKRTADIPQLVRYRLDVLNEKNGLAMDFPSRASLKNLTDYSFPGNIRELFNLVDRAYFTGNGGELEFGKMERPVEPVEEFNQLYLSYDDNVRNHIKRVLVYCDGKVSGSGGAAEMLGLKRSTLISKMKKLDIKAPA